VHRYLPKELLNRPKQGFSSALPYMLQREYRLLYDHFLPDSQLVKSGVVDARAIQRLLQAHLAGQADHGNRLWLLINSELWYRMMIQGESEARLRDELRRAGLSAPAAA
jgi:asparagine synthase (glutamine-hydrolysing)